MYGADQQSRQAEHRHELEVARLQVVAAGSPAAGGEASRFPSSCRRAWRGAGSSRYRRSRPTCGHDSIWCAVPSGLLEVRICSRVDPLQLGVSEYQEPATKGTPGRQGRCGEFYRVFGGTVATRSPATGRRPGSTRTPSTSPCNSGTGTDPAVPRTGTNSSNVPAAPSSPPTVLRSALRTPFSCSSGII